MFHRCAIISGVLCLAFSCVGVVSAQVLYSVTGLGTSLDFGTEGINASVIVHTPACDFCN